ncbi:MAG TPA: esterase [Janthinobacterium sp.]|nr:esterase [Janthinobacterium sp.]
MTNHFTYAGQRHAWLQTHSVSDADRAAMAALRELTAAHKGKLRGIAARAPFDDIMLRVSAPANMRYQEDTIGGVHGWWCHPEGAREGAAILHLHGGWFSWGSARTFRNLVGHIAQRANVSAFIPDYRLAPEHPYPAGMMDAVAVFRGLSVEHGLTVAVSGDSAGGGLALSLLSMLAAEAHGTQPVAAAVISPVTDLTLSGASWRTRAKADPYFVLDQGRHQVEAYLNGQDAAALQVSPLFADLAGLPPIRVHVGDDEVLLDDALRYAERAAAAGSDIGVEVWMGMAHGFAGAVGRMDAAGLALDAIAGFLAQQLS